MTNGNGTKLLQRLLGPGKPELSCEPCFEELDRYVESELAGRASESSVPGMRAHLLGCAACAEDYESLRDLVGSSSPGPSFRSAPA